MYYIEQVEGKLKDASIQLREAVKAGDMEMARAIYRQYVGDIPSDSMVWWTFNAPNRVARASGLTAEDYGTFTGNEERREYQAAYLAQGRVGGKWEVFYEY